MTGPAGPGTRRIDRSALGTIAAIAIVVATLVAPSQPSAAGAGGTVVPPPADPPPLGFQLPGSGGYKVEVYGAAGQDGEGGQVLVRAAARDRAVTYRFPAVVEEGVIQAELGAYGAISVVFRPRSGGEGVAEEGCNRGLSFSAGYYEGTISFRARGLTSAEASRAKGDNGLALNVLCAEEAGSQARPGTYLEVSGGATAPTMTVMEQGGVAAAFQAGISETSGGVPIERSVDIEAWSRAFRHRGLRSATITPPAPFSGSATFRREGHKTSWRGNLRVDFPGRPNVALTGTGLQARLHRARGSGRGHRRARRGMAVPGTLRGPDTGVRRPQSPATRPRNSRAVSHTSRHRASITSAWSRPGISMCSVRPGLRRCFL